MDVRLKNKYQADEASFVSMESIDGLQGRVETNSLIFIPGKCPR